MYLGGSYYTAPAVYVRQNNGSWVLHYICRDHQGSVTHVTNSGGSTVNQELSYDAWGSLRNPATQANYTPAQQPALFLGRGYTGHEHLPWFGLINMNARLYDPALGRFLSPDPYIQAPGFSQNYNRYSYCLNNPLMYTDEDGEIAWFIPVGIAIVGGTINLAANWKNVDGFWQGVTTFSVGAGAALLTTVSGGSMTPLAGAGLVAAGGAVTAANNNIVAQTGHNFSGMENVDWRAVGKSSVAGAASGFMGSMGGYLGGQLVGNLAINGYQITSPVLNHMIRQGTGGALGGFAGGFTSGLIMTGSWDEALRYGGQGAAYGLATGIGQGFASGFMDARRNGLNPWNGKPKYYFENLMVDGNTKIISAKFGDYNIEFGGDFTYSNRKLIIDGFDIDGKYTNQLGIKGVRTLFNEFGKQQKVNQIIINGAQRTTGANPGKRPSVTYNIKY